MKIKNFYKFAFIILVVMGISFVAAAHSSTSNDAAATIQDDNALITVDKMVHDFGTFAATDGTKSATFVITNNTGAPILITSARASCGCTVPDWTKTPIEPGKTGTVTAKYDPNNQSGPFEKTITIYTNSTPDRITVRIMGVVQ